MLAGKIRFTALANEDPDDVVIIVKILVERLADVNFPHDQIGVILAGISAVDENLRDGLSAVEIGVKMTEDVETDLNDDGVITYCTL
mgnify:CR=1 FL=1